MLDNINQPIAPHQIASEQSSKHLCRSWNTAASATAMLVGRTVCTTYCAFRRFLALSSSAASWSPRCIALNSKGFTVVELNIAIGISAVLSVAFLAIFTTFLVTSTRTNASIEMTSSSQILLRSITEELRYGGGVQQKNTIDDLNSDEPAGGWSTSNDTAVIITAVPALDASNQYIIDPAIDRPYYNEFIYYQEGSILYKRTLANPNAAGNKSVNSCPVKTDTCPGDRKLVETLENMSFTLYDQDNVVITDPLLTNLARSIKIDLALRKQVIGNPLEFDNSIRITLRNVF